MKRKSWLVFGVMVIILAGCGVTEGNTKDSEKSANATTTTTTASATAKSRSSKTSTSTEVSETSNDSSSSVTASTTKETESSVAKKQSSTLWDNEKANVLADFMASWGKMMNQSYNRFSPGHNTDLYGLRLPDTVLSGNWTMAVDGQPVSVSWSDDGNGNADYQLVAVYSDAENATRMGEAHVYFFTLQNGVPKVFITQQNQGNPDNYLYFAETQNMELRNGFTNIVKNGQTDTASKTAPTENKITNVKQAYEHLRAKDNYNDDLLYNDMGEGIDEYGHYWQIKIASKEWRAQGGTGTLAQVRVYENGDIRDALELTEMY